MKFKIFLATCITGLVLSWISCKEETIGQYPVHGNPPGEVSNPVVQNKKGGAVITYDLPRSKDILYVKAEYTLPNGQKKVMKSSAFINSIEVLGFAKSAKVEVRLISVDRSQNESKAVTCEIEPLDSPIFDIYESLSVVESFGGVRLNWENLDRSDIMIGVIYKNEEGIYEEVDNVYSSTERGISTLRGLPSVETDFGVFIRDIYDNYTDTLFATLTPWLEFELDKNLWSGLPRCSSFTVSTFGGPIENLWDGVTITDRNPGTYYLNTTSASNPIFFTIDLGVTAKFSRFKFWGRDLFYFALHHPKEFEVWGTNDRDAAFSDPCGWNDKWLLLLSGTSEKPSGPDLLSFDNLTSEDMALAHAGEEFEFPLDVPAVRYIRFKTVRTWSNSLASHVAELSFWGNIAE